MQKKTRPIAKMGTVSRILELKKDLQKMKQSKKGTQPTMFKILQLTLSLAALAVSAQAESLLETFGSGDDQFQMEFVTIGNPGNAADTTGSPNPAGRVLYNYNIGKYEVSRGMIEKANAAGGLGITLADMSGYGGNGVNRPATGISWNEAARFVNYLNTSKGYQAAYNFTTSGVNDNITMWGPGQYSGSNQFRHKDAIYVLPSMDEWYKAAYGSPSGTWYDYANGSNSAPTAVASGTSGAVYGQSGPADITNAGGLSQYGTMAQNGNAREWNESAFDGSNDSASESRVLRGGSHVVVNPVHNLGASYRDNTDPTLESSNVGFRVASVPEPSSGLLVLLGLSAVLRRRRKRSGLAV
jgi:formylglycine-generating enzyme required for sulfatase activity